MKKVLDKPLLGFLLERVARSKKLNEIIVATTLQENDDHIAQFCNESQISCFRGEVDDVLSRYLKAAQQSSAEIIVRITGDCPLMDPEIIDKVVQHYLDLYPEIDFVSNTLKRTYPRGMDVEVFSFESLKTASESSVKIGDREHVTSFIYSHPDRFRLANVSDENDYSRYRWTVDTSEDFQLVENLIKEIYPQKENFIYSDLLKAMEAHPEWYFINSHVEQKKI